MIRRTSPRLPPTDEGEVCLVETSIDLRVRESAHPQLAARLEPTDEGFRQTQASGHSFGVALAHDLPGTLRWCGAEPMWANAASRESTCGKPNPCEGSETDWSGCCASSASCWTCSRWIRRVTSY